MLLLKTAEILGMVYLVWIQGGLGMIQGFRVITVCWAAQSLVVHGVDSDRLAKPGCYAALLEHTGIAP